jgi:putative ABC transport system substrate-binding protein
MGRREFVTLMGGAAIVWPVTTRAQEQGRTYRLGSLQQSRRDAPHHVAFYDELRRQGFVEGQNLLVDAQGMNCGSTSLRSTQQRSSKPR